MWHFKVTIACWLEMLISKAMAKKENKSNDLLSNPGTQLQNKRTFSAIVKTKTNKKRIIIMSPK